MKLKNKRICILLSFTMILIILMVANSVSAGEKETLYLADRYGMSAVIGESYNPDNIDFYMLSGFLLYDYEKIWKHRAPEQLRFKLEGSIGSAHYGKNRLVASMNIFALRYLDFLKTPTLKPYIEGGIGIIYTDFQVRGQGLRTNFNPQLGIGTEINTRFEKTLFFSLRFHHISNGGLDDDNRGLNSVMAMFGYYF